MYPNVTLYTCCFTFINIARREIPAGSSDHKHVRAVSTMPQAHDKWFPWRTESNVEYASTPYSGCTFNKNYPGFRTAIFLAYLIYLCITYLDNFNLAISKWAVCINHDWCISNSVKYVWPTRSREVYTDAYVNLYILRDLAGHFGKYHFNLFQLSIAKESLAPTFRASSVGPTCWHQGLYSLSGKTSYRKISWSLEAARFEFRLFISLWNLTGTSAVVLPRCLSNFGGIRSS